MKTLAAKQFAGWALVLTLTVISCRRDEGSEQEIPDEVSGLEMPGAASDVVAAFFRFDNGRQRILVGRLHSRMYRNLGFGDYPAVSPSGKYVAYNPEGDPRFSQRPGIPPIIVKEVATGKEIRFASIPEETRPWPGSRWSADETLIAFEVHDFEGNRSQAVVSVEDGSFWRGTREEFRVRYASAFPEVSSPLSVQSVTGQPDYHGWAANAVFYHPDSGPPVRLTPENMWISSSLGTAVWIERTGEVVFPAVWHSDLEISGPIEKRASPTPTIFVIKARARDWRNASREEWDAAALFEAEQVSCSR